MLAYIRNHDGFFKYPVHRLQDILWRHDRLLLHLHRVLLLPLAHFLQPFLRIALRHIFQHLLDRLFCVCYDGHVNLHVSGDGCRIDINMHDLGMGGK